jgi:hypothetical protein
LFGLRSPPPLEPNAAIQSFHSPDYSTRRLTVAITQASLMRTRQLPPTKPILRCSTHPDFHPTFLSAAGNRGESGTPRLPPFNSPLIQRAAERCQSAAAHTTHQASTLTDEGRAIRGRLHWLVRRRLNSDCTRSDFKPPRHPSMPRRPRRRVASSSDFKGTRSGATCPTRSARCQHRSIITQGSSRTTDFRRETRRARRARPKPFKIPCPASRRTPGITRRAFNVSSTASCG